METVLAPFMIPSVPAAATRLRNGQPNLIAESAPGGTRTHDLRFRRPLLYPVELRAQRAAARCSEAAPYFAFLWAFGKQMCRRAGNTFDIDSDEEIRTLTS